MKIRGVNLGNWLVLEKWMSPSLFDGTTAEDEYYLPMQLDRSVYEARIKQHRSEYITERDFITMRAIGLNTVRIPVPYLVPRAKQQAEWEHSPTHQQSFYLKAS